MADSRFFRREGPFSLAELADKIGLSGVDSTLEINDVVGLDEAMPGQLSFLSNAKLSDALATSKAGAVLVSPAHAELCGPDTLAVICDDPYRAMAQTAQIFYPDAAQARPPKAAQQDGHMVHPKAIIGADVTVEAGAIIGPEAEIGDGCFIGAGAVIGHGTVLGRNCTIGPNATVSYSLLGDNVIIHAGAQIGTDGFGFAPGAAHTKIPQLGRVILQADVEVGGNSTIDRGALGDTIVGEGSKFDNLVHIAHNVKIGRHCFITATCAVAGSAVLGDYVQMGGGAKITGHVTIGDRCVVAAASTVLRPFPADSEVAGSPAQIRSETYRDLAFIRRLRKKAPDKDA